MHEGTECTDKATDVEIVFNCFDVSLLAFWHCIRKGRIKKGLLLPGSAHVCVHPKRMQRKVIFASLFMAQINRVFVFWKDLPVIGKLLLQ